MSVTQILAAQPWVERLGLTLLHFLWQGAMIVTIYAAARKWGTRTLDPNGRYLLACAALAAMALASLVTWIVLRPPAPGGAATFPAPLSAVRTGPARSLSPDLPGGAYPALPGQFLSWVVAFWLAGTTAFSLRLLFGWMAAERLRYRMVRPAPAEWQRILDHLKGRVSVDRPVRLLVSGLLDAPAAIGWLRPVVLVPVGALTGLPPAQIEALLLHELAHVRRYDYPVHILQSAMEAIFFYHPAVWWVSGQMRAERELCCDDIAVSITGDAVAYVRALAEFDSARWIRPTVMAANGGSLSGRIARLLGQSPASRRTSSGPASAGALILLAIGGWAVFAQPTGQPHFEVASVKPSVSPGIQHVRPLPGRLTADASLRILMQYAYGVQPFQVIGGPERVMSARYEIDAKADGNAGRARMFLMLRSLLEDRYQLKAHRETRELPAYALVAARSGLRLPPPKEGMCVDSPADAPVEWAGGRMAVPGEIQPAKGFCGSASVHLEPAGARMQGGAIAMPELVRMLSLVLGRSVIDKTGFGERFDLQLDFVADETTPAMPPPPPGSDMPGPSISQALRRQLGLELESTKGPVEVLVVDHAELPSGN
jgi:uncharacterized protein (TIGR03435 family)